MDPAPLGKGPQWKQYDKFKRGRFIKFRKEISSKLGRKEIHQGEIRFWESIKLWEKKKAIKLEKTSTKKREREREVNARIFIKLWKNTDSSKIIQVEKDEQKWRFIKSKIQSNWGKEKVRYIS